MNRKPNKRALKPKTVERLEVLQRKHPGDLTDSERTEMEKLQKYRSKYGQL